MRACDQPFTVAVVQGVRTCPDRNAAAGNVGAFISKAGRSRATLLVRTEAFTPLRSTGHHARAAKASRRTPHERREDPGREGARRCIPVCRHFRMFREAFHHTAS